MAKEVPSEVDRLLRSPFENYYQTLATFVRIAELRKPKEEADDNGR